MIVIRGLAGVVTGRVDEPRRDLSQLVLSDGVIADPAELVDSAEVVDAGGRWASFAIDVSLSAGTTARLVDRRPTQRSCNTLRPHGEVLGRAPAFVVKQ